MAVVEVATRARGGARVEVAASARDGAGVEVAETRGWAG